MSVQNSRVDGVRLERQPLKGEWKGIWTTLKRFIKEKSKNGKLKKYNDKKMQSEVYGKLDEEIHRPLQRYMGPKKVASILAAEERMVETTGHGR